jgi:hypothetical protein
MKKDTWECNCKFLQTSKFCESIFLKQCLKTNLRNNLSYIAMEYSTI